MWLQWQKLDWCTHKQAPYWSKPLCDQPRFWVFGNFQGLCETRCHSRLAPGDVKVLVHSKSFYTVFWSHIILYSFLISQENRSHNNRQQNSHFSDNVAFFLMLVMLFAHSETFFMHSILILNHKNRKRMHHNRLWNHHTIVMHIPWCFLCSKNVIDHKSKRECITSHCGIAT